MSKTPQELREIYRGALNQIGTLPKKETEFAMSMYASAYPGKPVPNMYVIGGDDDIAIGIMTSITLLMCVIAFLTLANKYIAGPELKIFGAELGEPPIVYGEKSIDYAQVFQEGNLEKELYERLGKVPGMNFVSPIPVIRLIRAKIQYDETKDLPGMARLILAVNLYNPTHPSSKFYKEIPESMLGKLINVNSDIVLVYRSFAEYGNTSADAILDMLPLACGKIFHSYSTKVIDTHDEHEPTHPDKKDESPNTAMHLRLSHEEYAKYNSAMAVGSIADARAAMIKIIRHSILVAYYYRKDITHKNYSTQSLIETDADAKRREIRERRENQEQSARREIRKQGERTIQIKRILQDIKSSDDREFRERMERELKKLREQERMERIERIERELEAAKPVDPVFRELERLEEEGIELRKQMEKIGKKFKNSDRIVFKTLIEQERIEQGRMERINQIRKDLEGATPGDPILKKRELNKLIELGKFRRIDCELEKLGERREKYLKGANPGDPILKERELNKLIELGKLRELWEQKNEEYKTAAPEPEVRDPKLAEMTRLRNYINLVERELGMR